MISCLHHATHVISQCRCPVCEKKCFAQPCFHLTVSAALRTMLCHMKTLGTLCTGMDHASHG